MRRFPGSPLNASNDKHLFLHLGRGLCVGQILLSLKLMLCRVEAVVMEEDAGEDAEEDVGEAVDFKRSNTASTRITALE